jgi:hypothetical protein
VGAPQPGMSLSVSSTAGMEQSSENRGFARLLRIGKPQ